MALENKVDEEYKSRPQLYSADRTNSQLHLVNNSIIEELWFSLTEITKPFPYLIFTISDCKNQFFG